MSKFQKNIKLLSPSVQVTVKKVMPEAKNLIPEARERAKRAIFVLTAARERLIESMEMAQ